MPEDSKQELMDLIESLFGSSVSDETKELLMNIIISKGLV